MKTITLNKDGSLSSDDAAQMEIDPIEKLGDQVVLAGGYCFRSFFKMLDAYPVLMRLSAFFPGVMQRYREIAVEPQGMPKATLEFLKTVEMIGFPGDPRLEIYNSFRSTFQGDTGEFRSTDLSGLLDIPITLGRLQHIVFGDKVNVLEFDTIYTFFEFIDGIAWEFGFHTTPAECQIRR